MKPKFYVDYEESIITTNLNAVREFSQGLREILKTSSVNRLAIYRPQDNFHSDEELTQPDKIKSFVTLESARTWLLKCKSHDLI